MPAPSKREAAAVRRRVSLRNQYGPTQVEKLTGKAAVKPRGTGATAAAKVAATLAKPRPRPSDVKPTAQQAAEAGLRKTLSGKQPPVSPWAEGCSPQELRAGQRQADAFKSDAAQLRAQAARGKVRKRDKGRGWD
jgi:hypothetical protein